ncbi:hypothetical protein [Streptomyces broussonetiae]|nr:hypothetical protein [Streptomyces broussonetiae]
MTRITPARCSTSGSPGPVQCTLLGIAAVASGSYAGYVLFELGVP